MKEGDPTPKRGRGRPRKYPKPDPDAPPKPKRGRGRPRKYPLEPATANQVHPGKPIENESENEEKGAPVQQGQPKRGRGRPRKSETAIAPSASAPQTGLKRGRGRPTKEEAKQREEEKARAQREEETTISQRVRGIAVPVFVPEESTGPLQPDPLFAHWFEGSHEKAEKSILTGSERQTVLTAYEKDSLPILGLAPDAGDEPSSSSSSTSPQGKTLQQFQRSWVRAVPREREKTDAAQVNKKPNAYVKLSKELFPTNGNEMVFFSGGPVHSLRCCPFVARNSAANAVSFHVAIAPHSKDHKLNRYNLRLEGDALIQVVNLICAIRPAAIQDTQLCYSIRHCGAVTWDLAWCPSKQLPPESLGLLAAALGNGEVCIYCCPSKKIVDKESGKPAVLDLKPVMKSHDLQKRKSMPSCLAWYPDKPYDKLLVGCWNGGVALYQLASDRMYLLSFFSADLYALRSVFWLGGDAPNHEGSCSLYVTSGHNGTIRFWHRKKPQQVVCQKVTGLLTHVMDMALCKSPLGFLSANSDGQLRFLQPTSQGINTPGSAFSKNCLVSVDANDEYYLFTTSVGETFLGVLQNQIKGLDENGDGIFRWKSPNLQSTTSMTLNSKGVLSLESWSFKTKEEDLNPPEEIVVYKSEILPCIPEWESEVFVMHGSGSGLVRFQLHCNSKKKRKLTLGKW